MRVEAAEVSSGRAPSGEGGGDRRGCAAAASSCDDSWEGAEADVDGSEAVERWQQSISRPPLGWWPSSSTAAAADEEVGLNEVDCEHSKGEERSKEGRERRRLFSDERGGEAAQTGRQTDIAAAADAGGGGREESEDRGAQPSGGGSGQARWGSGRGASRDRREGRRRPTVRTAFLRLRGRLLGASPPLPSPTDGRWPLSSASASGAAPRHCSSPRLQLHLTHFSRHVLFPRLTQLDRKACLLCTGYQPALWSCPCDG